MKQAPYKLVSFDIWNTLIKSNPDYVTARNKLYMSMLENDDDVFVKKIKDEVDIYFDQASESTGDDYNFSVRMKRIFEHAKKDHHHLSDLDWEEFRQKLNTLAHLHPPLLIESNMKQTLENIKKNGHKIAFVSNTGFLHGDIMRELLSTIGLLPYADYTLFSNEIGKAKPHPHIFQELIKLSECKASEILHIGDSVRADYHGAKAIGIDAITYDPKSKHSNRLYSISNMHTVFDLHSLKTNILHREVLSLSENLDLINGELIDDIGNRFDAYTYSKFKYGDGVAGRKYGHQLAKKFIEKHPYILDPDFDSKSLVISTSPYKSIVKGSSSIVSGFKTYINQVLLQYNKEPIIDIVILKDTMFSGDYGTMSEYERKSIMTHTELFVMDSFIQNKKIILIDDARITGTHESEMIHFFSSKNIDRIYFLYVADMNQSIGKSQPDIESNMNHAWMDNLDKLTTLVNSKEFVLNARVCKYVLSIGDKTKLLDFIDGLDEKPLYDMFGGMVSDGYASMDIYRQNFEIIKDTVAKRGLL